MSSLQTKANGAAHKPVVSKNSGDAGITYPEVPLGDGTTAQKVWVTPEMASRFLASVTKVQRTLRSLHLASLSEDMRTGRFLYNAETAVLDSDDHLMNGSHRFTSIVETGIAQHILIIRGVNPSVYHTYDNTAKRTGQDALRSDGIENAALVSAAAVMLKRYERNMIRGMGSASQIRLSPISIMQAVLEHPDLVESAKEARAAHAVCRHSSAAVFCHYILSKINPILAADFFSRLVSGADLTESDPILKLRNRLMSTDKYDRDDVVYFIFKACNSIRKGTKSPGVYKRGGTFQLPC